MQPGSFASSSGVSISSALSVPFRSLAACAALSSAAFAQGIDPIQTATSTSGSLGTDVAAVGLIDMDGIADYVVSRPFVDNRGLGIGQVPGQFASTVSAYSGADGSTLWTASGDFNFTVCTTSVPQNDRFGVSLATIPDRTGDGIAEIVVGAPLHAPLAPGGGCRTPGVGRVSVLDGSNGQVIGTVDGTVSGDFLGFDVASAGDVVDANGAGTDGTPDYLAVGGNFVAVISGATDQIILQLPFGGPDLRVCYAGDFNGDGQPMEIAIGDITNDTVWVRDVLNQTTVGYVGPTSFGASLAIRPEQNNVPDRLLVGAPFDIAEDGSVNLLDASGAVTTIFIGESLNGAGYDIDVGGDGDGDGQADDVLVGCIYSSVCHVITAAGTQIRRVANADGDAVAWVPSVDGDAYDEALIGNAESAYTLGRIAPQMAINQTFGLGGPATAASIPILTASDTTPSPGNGQLRFQISGAQSGPNLMGTLFFGVPNLAAPPVVVGGFVLPLSIDAPQALYGFSTSSGTWTSPQTPITNFTSLVGTTLGFQALMFQPGQGQPTAVWTSNGVEVLIGW